MAFCLRLYGIFDLPMDFYPVRQYHSALLARGFFEWLLTGELDTLPPDGIIEPPILELVTSFSYLIFGEEHLWIPRLLSALFWMVGGVFLYQIAKKISSPNGAVFSVFFYLFAPYSVLPSRAFMPDPLMIMLLLISVFTILRYHEQPSSRRLAIAALASSLAVFAKPVMCFFQIFGAFVSLAVYRRGVRRTLTSPHLWIFTGLSVLPAGFYYLYGTLIAGFLKPDISGRVVPRLLLEALFWEFWGAQIGLVVGYTALIGALLGILLLHPGLPRVLMIGLWGGYLLFGLVYTQHIQTHDYYSLQLIPVVALSLGPIGTFVTNQLKQPVHRGYPSRGGRLYTRQVIILALCILALIFNLAEHRIISNIASNLRGATQPTSKYANNVATYQEIGEVVNHSRHTLLLFGNTLDYGFPLLYHGRFSAVLWPRSHEQGELSTEELFNDLSSEDSAEYFIISTKTDYVGSWESEDWESEKYEELRSFLTKRFPMIAQGEDYVVFDLREKN
jgi:hypothetical protein